jgi:hypothetical protein
MRYLMSCDRQMYATEFLLPIRYEHKLVTRTLFATDIILSSITYHSTHTPGKEYSTP